MLHRVIVLCFFFLLTACGITPTKVSKDQIGAEYSLLFESLWTPNSPHSGDSFPSSAHFSPPVLITHTSQAQFWAEGQTASEGVESMAEVGGTRQLGLEFSSKQRAHEALAALDGDSFDWDEKQTITIAANTHADRLTVLTMIAPSPDWFVGLNGIALRNADGTWKDKITCELVGYDAGTEEGVRWSLSNDDTNPVQSIHKLSDSAALQTAGYDLSSPFLKVTITRIGGDKNAPSSDCL